MVFITIWSLERKPTHEFVGHLKYLNPNVIIGHSQRSKKISINFVDKVTHFCRLLPATSWDSIIKYKLYRHSSYKPSSVNTWIRLIQDFCFFYEIFIVKNNTKNWKEKEMYFILGSLYCVINCSIWQHFQIKPAFQSSFVR